MKKILVFPPKVEIQIFINLVTYWLLTGIDFVIFEKNRGKSLF